jgi:hypothetical protein
MHLCVDAWIMSLEKTVKVERARAVLSGLDLFAWVAGQPSLQQRP